MQILFKKTKINLKHEFIFIFKASINTFKVIFNVYLLIFSSHFRIF